MNACELVYDRPGIYCRLYTCPECKGVFETFLDKKGDRLSNLDTWWRPAVSKEETVNLVPKQLPAQKSLPEAEKQTAYPEKVKQPEKPADTLLPANKPAAAERKTTAGPARAANTAVSLPPQNKPGAAAGSTMAARATEQPKRVSPLEMQVGSLLPASNSAAAGKPVPERVPNKAKQGKNKEKTSSLNAKFAGIIPMK